MRNRFKKFHQEHEEAVFFWSTLVIGVCAGALVGMKVANDSKVIHIHQYLDENETVALGAVLKNGQERIFRTCIPVT